MTMSPSSLLFPNASPSTPGWTSLGLLLSHSAYTACHFTFWCSPCVLPPVSEVSASFDQYNWCWSIIHHALVLQNIFGKRIQLSLFIFASLDPSMVYTFIHSFIPPFNTSFMNSTMCQVLGIQKLSSHFLRPLKDGTGKLAAMIKGILKLHCT